MKKTHANQILEAFCQSLFKCSYVLKELLDPSSTITKTLVNNLNYNAEPQAALYNNIATFDNFRRQICTNGFTFMWGLNYLRDWGEAILAQINEWVDIITRNRLRIRKRLESYLYAIEDYGILDLLNRLHNFFNCVLDATIDSCATIATSQNFYKKCTGALHIKEVGYGQYKLTDSWVKQKLGMCDNVTRTMNGISSNLAKIMSDAGITSKNLSNAQGAFNLANFVRDTKRAIDRGDWTRIPGVKLASRTWDNAKEFGNALAELFTKVNNSTGGTEANPIVDLSFDNLIEHVQITTDNKIWIRGLTKQDGSTVADIDVTNASLFAGGTKTTEQFIVSNTDSETAAYLLKGIYWSDELKRFVSNAYMSDVLIKKFDNETFDDPKDDKLANELMTKNAIIADMSDITKFATKY